MGIVIAVVVLFVVIFGGIIAYYRRPPQLTRHPRSTRFGRGRSERIRQAAADDVATILAGDGYAVPDPAAPDDL